MVYWSSLYLLTERHNYEVFFLVETYIRKTKEQLNDLYPSPNTIRLIKLGKLKWTWYVVPMGRVGVYTGFWWGHPKERDHLEDTGIDGRIWR